MDPSALSGEWLTRHSSFLRALARGLLDDEQLAEDACQEAVLATLRQPPPVHVNPVAWLATLTRRAALGIRRSAARRERRESEVARANVQPSSMEAPARAEVLLRVSECVVALPEPYRATLLARYYEELTPTAIAARDGVPLPTVKSRLARAHAMLRERLDRTSGNDRHRWQSDLAALCGLPSTSLLLPAIAMSTTAKLGLLAAALFALASGAWFALDFNEPHATASAKDDVAADARETRVESPPPQPEVQVDRAAVAVAPVANAERVLVWGDIRGPTLEELQSDDLEFFDESGVARKASIGEPSSYSLFGLVPGTYRVVAWHRGFLPLDDEVIVPSGQAKMQHDLVFVRSLVLPVKIVDQATGELIPTSSFDPIGVGLAVAATLTRPVRIEGVLGRKIYRSEAGFYNASRGPREDPLIPAGASGTLEITAPTPVFASLVMRGIVMESRAVTGTESELVFRVDRAALEAMLGSLALRCVDAISGEPIRDAGVAVSFRDSSGGGVSKSDAQGAVRIERLTPGLRLMSLGSSKSAGVERWVSIEPGQTLDLGIVELYSKARVGGRLCDPNGSGVSAPMRAISLSHQLTPRNAESRMSYKSATDGSFSMDWVEATRLRLVAEPTDWALAALDVDASSGSVGQLVIPLVHGTEVSVRIPRGSNRGVEFLLADGDGVPLLFAGVWGARPRRILLRPGRYVLSTVAEDRVVSQQTLEVGDSTVPVIVELR